MGVNLRGVRDGGAGPGHDAAVFEGLDSVVARTRRLAPKS